MLLTRNNFCISERFTQMKSSGGYYVTVIEDKRISKIIGAATLTIEQKFIHNCSVVCTILFENSRRKYLL